LENFLQVQVEFEITVGCSQREEQLKKQDFVKEKVGRKWSKRCGI